MTVNIIDPHLHLFNLSRGDYHWLKAQNPPFWPDKMLIQKDFSVTELSDCLHETSKIKLAGFVHIEAGFDNTQPWRELEYIESIPSQSNRTVASIDLLATPESFQATLQRLQQYKSLIGARHILDEQAATILANKNATHNFGQLNEITDFIFEVQLPLADESAINVMPLLTQTITTNSQLQFIINHAGFPPKRVAKDINNHAWHLWQQHINELAKYPNVFIKCSGWEMTDRHYAMSWFSQVCRFCINEFSIKRVMLASNFPLCLLGKEGGKKLSNKSYSSYWQDILKSTVIEQCNKSEKNALLYNNALRIYKLSNSQS
jgi:predicted TIM-barrel fold metal-dependent hydrolase